MMNIKLEYANETLFAFVSGILDLNEANRCADQLLEEAITCAATKGLIDCRGINGSFSTADRYAHTDYLAEIVLKAIDADQLENLNLSVIAHPPILDPHRFGETIARNRGVDIRCTESVPEALSWISLEETDLLQVM